MLALTRCISDHDGYPKHASREQVGPRTSCKKRWPGARFPPVHAQASRHRHWAHSLHGGQAGRLRPYGPPVVVVIVVQDAHNRRGALIDIHTLLLQLLLGSLSLGMQHVPKLYALLGDSHHRGRPGTLLHGSTRWAFLVRAAPGYRAPGRPERLRLDWQR